MKKLAHSVELSVFITEEEEDHTEALTGKLSSLVPFSLEEEKVKLVRQAATGFNERMILIAKITLTTWRHVRAVLEHIRDSLSEQQRALILRQARSRLDRENRFYLRFDKNALLEKDKLELTDSGECFHIRITFAVYPKTEGAALKAVEEWLGSE